MELIFISVFLKIVKNFYFIAVSLEVCPYIPVDRYNNLASQILCHSQNVNGCHFVLHTDRVLTKRTKCNINIIILSVFCKINGKMGISGMINVSTWCLYQIVYCFIIHISWANTCQFFSVWSCRICCYNTGSVKGIKCNNLNVLNLNSIPWLYGNAAICRNSPFLPQLN